MFDDFIREIHEQLEAIRLTVMRPPKVRTPNAKAPPKTTYGWFKHSWGDAEFRAMLVSHTSTTDPVEAYKVLSKDDKGAIRALFEGKRGDGASDDGASDA